MRMTLQYTGTGCGASRHNQDDGKVMCEGGSASTEPVFIVVSDKKDEHVYAIDSNMPLNGTIEVDANISGRDFLSSETMVSIYSADDELIEQVVFHTSCSQPFRAGDQFGSIRIIAMTSLEGGEVTLNRLEQPCITMIQIPRPPHCNGKLKALRFRYAGGGCGQTNHGQNAKKVRCANFGPWQNNHLIEPVRIVAFSGKKRKHIWLNTVEANVYAGDVVELLASNGRSKELKSNTTVQIFDVNGNLIEQVSLNTSCSQPLDLGDRFGSLEVFALRLRARKRKGQDTHHSLGAEVEYTYTVTNNGPTMLTNVTVIDDIFGEVPGSPIDSLEPGETVALVLREFISEETTNTATVVGYLTPEFVCEAAASATITSQPYGPLQAMCRSKIRAMLFEYTGPTILGATVEIFPKNKKFKNAPVVYDNVDLIAGTVLESPSENNMMINSLAHGAMDLGAKVSIFINGVEEVIHTSCSVPFEIQTPAPLDNPKGDPSPNWFVIDFDEKDD